MPHGIVGVRRALVEYHSSAVGHGMLISGLQDRVRRLEQHLTCRRWRPLTRRGGDVPY